MANSALLAFLALAAYVADAAPRAFLSQYCHDCHGKDSPAAGLDLTSLAEPAAAGDRFSQWVKVFDRVADGAMPPKTSPQPPAAERDAALAALRATLLAVEAARTAGDDAIPRRLTRGEYENTLRDLFDMPGLALRDRLPADGSAHGFDKNADALDLSRVHLARYMEAADHALDLAIATSATPPRRALTRVSLASQYIVQVILLNGDGVLLRDGQPDPVFPPSGPGERRDHAAEQRNKSFREDSTVGLFRHEDESFNPNFQAFAVLDPGQYRLRGSFWSFGWDQGKVTPARGVEAVRLSVVHLTEDGRGGGHPSSVIGYFDAPPNRPQIHELEQWLNRKDTIGFNPASLAPVHIYNREGRAMAFTGPGVACDWLEIDGPIHPAWPSPAHRALFGDLPLRAFAEESGKRPPPRKPFRQEVTSARNRPEPPGAIVTVHAEQPARDADRLLAAFLPRAFRRPVDEGVRQQYVAGVVKRLDDGDCFESALRWAYRAALCSADFLFHVEPDGPLDPHALASRLSYFLWNSPPDDALRALADTGALADRDVLRRQVERMLNDRKHERFIDDFLGQWLKLRQLGANDPDHQLYPEFSPYLRDCMANETRAYFAEMLRRDLDARHLVRSDFAMLNERLATHYGIGDVRGTAIRRVALPTGHARGPFLTQSAMLTLTANGTTTSPVPRGAYVLGRLLGEEPEPPPAAVAAIEPDVRGAKTIREQLAKHRADVACAGCHAKIDPPGFALESFDVIGGRRERYRSIGAGAPAERGGIDPFIPLHFKLGPPVDPSGALADGQRFANIEELQALLASDRRRLTRNLARQLATYALGRGTRFADRDAMEAIVERTEQVNGGVRTLIHELTQSPLFHDERNK